MSCVSPSSQSLSLLSSSSSSSRSSSPSIARRRSGRSRTGTPSLAYPNRPPCTPEEMLQYQLDIDPITARRLVAADDTLVPIFNNARLKLRVRTIGNDNWVYARAPIRKEDFDIAFRSMNNLEYTARNFAERMKSELIINSSSDDFHAFVNLCMRYAKFRFSNRVTVAPVKFKNGTEAGILARAAVPKGTLISELSGVMSSDSVDVPDHSLRHQHCQQRSNKKSFFKPISIVRRSNGQAGDNVKCDRLLVGPARFVNHSCNPNSKLKPFNKTYAWAVETLREIQVGEEITVSYGEHYFAPGECECAPCQLKPKGATPETSTVVETISFHKQSRKRKLEASETLDTEPIAKRLRSTKK